MPRGKGRRRKRSPGGRRREPFGGEERGEAPRVRLKPQGLLALGQVRAGEAVVVGVEEMVDEVGGEGDQVGGEQPRRQDAKDALEHTYRTNRRARPNVPRDSPVRVCHDLPSRVMATMVTFGGIPLSLNRMTSPA